MTPNPDLALSATPSAAAPAPDAAVDQRLDPIPGHRAMWVGICLEFVEFAVFFAVYFSARWHYPEAFQTGASKLWTAGGVAITLAMVTSGWLLTRALAAMAEDRRRAALRWMLAALAVGALYPVTKLFEWRWNMAHGLDATAGVFVVVYWYLTINHFIHASWGLLGMAWCSARLYAGQYSAADHRGLQSLAVYWHATDLVWLMLFGLFYAYA
ncbi:cytochrome c oxidase subunit 3 [Ideonella sp.]|uniref:cytochrome c oxidase subunit 3 n=1 Tax=Ideonella sp. TaxID=1929293 RepID=UPI0035B25B60